jgi:hypothetical protein
LPRETSDGETPGVAIVILRAGNEVPEEAVPRSLRELKHNTSRGTHLKQHLKAALDKQKAAITAFRQIMRSIPRADSDGKDRILEALGEIAAAHTATVAVLAEMNKRSTDTPSEKRSARHP